MTLLLGSGGSTRSVDKDLMVGWVIVLDNKINRGNIETSGCHIGHNQDDVAFLLSKCVQVVSSLIHVHLTINSVTFVKFPNDRKQVIDMESSRCENNHLLLLDYFLEHIQ
jgi:hypothetical protein